MGLGYVVGCFISILIWGFDRQKIFISVNKFIRRRMENKLIIHILYVCVICIICFVLNMINNKEICNFITAFIVIDISNTEKKNVRYREKIKFYDSISVISKSTICGFIAPLLYIILFNDTLGIIYMMIYNIASLDDEYYLFRKLFTVLTIVPSFIGQVFLFIIYIINNRRWEINFKGDYFINFLTKPLLNVDILGAYIECINFYYHYNTKNTEYIKSYGDYNKKINNKCIRDYLNISYAICFIIFIIFSLIYSMHGHLLNFN